MKVVFIAGMARSGSTALGLLLGAHPSLIGVGELYHTLGPRYEFLRKRDSRLRCSCGRSIDECVLWGPVSSELEQHRTETFGERYKRVLDVFRAMFGNEILPVDASKDILALKALLTSVPAGDIKVLHLFRDVRSWTAAGRKQLVPPAPGQEVHLDRQLANATGGACTTERLQRSAEARSVLNPSKRRSAFRLFLGWYLRNRQIEFFLDRAALLHFALGYEEFAIQPEFIMTKVWNFLELSPVNTGRDLDPGTSHILWGNRMFWDKDRNTMITYDAEWLSGRSWIFPSLLLPFVKKYNARSVYGNVFVGS